VFQLISSQNAQRNLIAIFILFVLGGCSSTNSQHPLDLLELESVIVITRTNYNSPTQAIETIKLVSQHIIPKLLK